MIVSKYNKRDWKVRLVLCVGEDGTAKEFEKYGERLLCVRYRYDGKGKRIKTVEIVEETALLTPKGKVG